MTIEPSFKGVSQFLKENADLIKEIQDTASTAEDIVTSLADRLEANQKASEELVANIEKIPFQVAKKRETRDRQVKLLSEIEKTKEKIQKYRDDPTMAGLYETELSAFYQELGKTYLEESVGEMITFTQKEIDEIRVLLRKAALDTQARQNIADILDAAVQIGKLALNVLVKLSA